MEEERVSVWVWLPLCVLMIVAGAWLVAASGVLNPRYSKRSIGTRTLNNAKMIGYACRMYAEDHGGNFPETLGALYPLYITDRAVFTSPLEPGNPDPFVYTHGLTLSSPADTIVIQFKSGRYRFVVHVDDSVQALRDP